MKLTKYILCLCALGSVVLNYMVYAENDATHCKNSEIKQTCIESAATQDTILALDGTKNTRYLGIYKDIGGNSLNQKAFLRSDNTNNLSKNDLKKLKELNVKTVIDLRYPNETAKTPDKFKDVEWVKYHNITVAINRKYSLYDRYIKALECKKLIKNIFETIANAKEGTILFTALTEKTEQVFYLCSFLELQT